MIMYVIAHSLLLICIYYLNVQYRMFRSDATCLLQVTDQLIYAPSNQLTLPLNILLYIAYLY